MSELLKAIRSFNQFCDYYTMSLDLNVWAGREVTTVADLEEWINYHLGYSDASKEAYGYRDRTDTESCTLSDFRSTYKMFEEMIEENNKYYEERKKEYDLEDKYVMQGYDYNEAERLAKKEIARMMEEENKKEYKPEPMPTNGINIPIKERNEDFDDLSPAIL